MVFIRDEFPLDFEEIVEWDRQMTERINNYKTIYTEETAATLVDMATHYNWVDPKLLATMVLTGNHALLPKIAEHAAIKMGDAGFSPIDREKSNRMINAYQTFYRKKKQ